jgi:hypothetical protein
VIQTQVRNEQTKWLNSSVGICRRMSVGACLRNVSGISENVGECWRMSENVGECCRMLENVGKSWKMLEVVVDFGDVRQTLGLAVVILGVH